MAHSVALYTVRVKEAWKDYQPLGDFDGNGTSLIDVLDNYLQGFEQFSADQEKVARAVAHRVDGDDDDELVVSLQHGITGIAADIVAEDGAARLRQISTDSHLVRMTGLFKLDPTQRLGWLALQVTGGRGVKGLLENGLTPRFRNDYTDYRLLINPYVPSGALRQAMIDGDVSSVKLIRYERPTDRASASTSKWIRSGEAGKLTVEITGMSRTQRLKSQLFRRLFGDADGQGAQGALTEIFEFEGIPFQTAKVEVELDGRRRTVNLESPSSGHPLTIDLENLELDDDGDPSEESVLRGLRGALESVAD